MTYIRTTPQKLWSALTDFGFMKQYWFGMHCESDWTAGSAWKKVSDDGKITDAGSIVEAEPPRRLVIRWQNQLRPERKAEGESLCTMELKASGTAVKLSITHTIDEDQWPATRYGRDKIRGLSHRTLSPCSKPAQSLCRPCRRSERLGGATQMYLLSGIPYAAFTVAGVLLWKRWHSIATSLVALGFAAALIGQVARTVSYLTFQPPNEAHHQGEPFALRMYYVFVPWQHWIEVFGIWAAALGLLWHATRKQ